MGYYVNFSATHAGYHTAFRYGFIPTSKKPKSELDPTPYLSENHPEPQQAASPPKTASADEKRRRQKRKQDGNGAKAGTADKADSDEPASDEPASDGHAKSTTRPKRQRVSKAVCAHNTVVSLCMTSGDDLVAFAVAENGDGRHQLLDFLHRNDADAFVEKVWSMERAKDTASRSKKSRLEILREAAEDSCVCEGKWTPALTELLHNNEMSGTNLAGAIYSGLTYGARKGLTVVMFGPPNAGKTFALKPLRIIYRAHPKPPRGCNFPLVDLHQSEIILWNDFRYQEATFAWEDLLNLFEGEQILIARPQNNKSTKGHSMYTPTQPTFISCDEFPRHPRNNPVENSMMRKRCQIFEFKHTMQVTKVIKPCTRCFANWVIGSACELAKPAEPHAPPPPPPGPRHAGDWDEHLDGGRPYYHNTDTGATTWDPPDEFREIFSQASST